MAVEVRKLNEGEERAFVRSVMVPFLEPITGDADSQAMLEYEASTLEVDRTWVVESAGRFVGNCCTYTMDVTVPSGLEDECPVVQMAGVSAVGVHPTYRRRGLLKQMMSRMLADARERGEPLAGLVASESIIYGRYGFGHATDRTALTIDSRTVSFLRPVPDLDLELIEKDEASKVLPAIFEHQRRARAGEVNREAEFWDKTLLDLPQRRRGGKPMFIAVCDDGYVSYRAYDADTLNSEYHKVVIEELRGVTPEVEAGLWKFVLDLDLVGPVTARRRPVDEPVRWRLADPRQLVVDDQTDFLHLRILDVVTALEARKYRTPGRLVLDLLPPAVDEGKADGAVGRWVLDAGPDGSECRAARSGEAPDLRMEVTDLGSLYLGGFPASALAAGGRIDELTAGSLARADSLFATRLAPVTTTGF